MQVETSFHELGRGASASSKFDLTRARVEEILGYAPAMSLSPSDYFMQGLELGLWRLLLTS